MPYISLTDYSAIKRYMLHITSGPIYLASVCFSFCCVVQRRFRWCRRRHDLYETHLSIGTNREYHVTKVRTFVITFVIPVIQVTCICPKSITHVSGRRGSCQLVTDLLATSRCNGIWERHTTQQTAPTCYRLATDLSYMLQTCCGLVTGKSPTCYGLAMGKTGVMDFGQ